MNCCVDNKLCLFHGTSIVVKVHGKYNVEIRTISGKLNYTDHGPGISYMKWIVVDKSGSTIFISGIHTTEELFTYFHIYVLHNCIRFSIFFEGT
jgi:hypothetical protein